MVSSLHVPAPSPGTAPDAGAPPPVVTAEPGADPGAWSAGRRAGLRAALLEYGAVLVRGLGLREAGQVAAVAAGLAAEPVPEREAFAPRRTYRPGVYSSAVWPPNQPMCMHHELSYALGFPGLLLIACLVPPERGGETGTADAADVLAALPPEVVRRFEERGWLLTRTYGGDIGATVTESFGTDDRAVVEAYCRGHAIDCAWEPDGTLRTRQRRPAVVRHPADGRRSWCNQIAFLSSWTLDPELREYLVDVYGPESLPFDTRYGDGRPVEAGTVELINEVYAAHTARHRWAAGDLLLVDNVRTAHSREPYEGPRELVLAMADPVSPALSAPPAGPSGEVGPS
ncbi:TauD/TfdA family dioxygenase [Streptomyces sp. LP05-1]|uniref:TauD/TfdA family dioxygenase n=1 Tax=Streptomyces pyxinae TaxID=2970734 RepID=A0ABT2CHH7_9ACTN|nr:TauD/TfdA family dioxygenase [Streptomyces sp. LP05-1]MCS0636860.1 TauD/TfdA family dioxygenase [Streptomyces sp. LP05-1]